MFKGDLDKPTYTWTYALTVTLKPQVRRYTAEEQYDKYARNVVDLIKVLFPGCILTLVCELTKSFDIHFHGKIAFKTKNVPNNVTNIPRWFSNKFRGGPTVGFVLLKVITDHEVWDDYIRKTMVEFKEDMDRDPMVCSP